MFSNFKAHDQSKEFKLSIDVLLDVNSVNTIIGL